MQPCQTAQSFLERNRLILAKLQNYLAIIPSMSFLSLHFRSGVLKTLKKNTLIVGRTFSEGKFIRSKPHLNIGTIGHVDHGKTTLTAAITKGKPSLLMTVSLV